MTISTPSDPVTVTARESHEVARANASGRQPVVLIHGLWLLPSSWSRWAEAFEEAGYSVVTADWPDDPATTFAAHARPEVFAGKTARQIVAHLTELIGGLDRKPVLVGHSFGGLFAEMLAGRGAAAATVAIAPAPFRGVLPLPRAALQSAFPVLRYPANRKRAVKLTLSQFRFAFANAVGDGEADDLYRTYAVPASGGPIFEAAAANLNPWSALEVDTTAADRGPLLILSGELDNLVPAAVTGAAFRKQARNEGVTEHVDLEGRGHALTIDAGWREVADRALGFVERFAPSDAKASAPVVPFGRPTASV